VTKYLNLEEKELTSSNETIIVMVVEKAALGIIEEGKKIGKKCEAEWIAKNDKDEEIWRNKLDTVGPFCLLLCNHLFNDKSIKKFGTVYRGTTLSPTEINLFKDDCFRNPKPERSFQPFTTCSRNRSIAEIYGGNTLLMMELEHEFIVDLAPFSEYPHEEEVLFLTAVCFTVERVDFDKVKSKYLFYLSLKRRPNSKLIFYLTYIFQYFFR
jgi:hypothetical protein